MKESSADFGSSDTCCHQKLCKENMCKSLDAQKEKAAEVCGGCVGGGGVLWRRLFSLHTLSADTPPPLAALTSARCETFIYAASCAAARTALSSRLLSKACRRISCQRAVKRDSGLFEGPHAVTSQMDQNTETGTNVRNTQTLDTIS